MSALAALLLAAAPAGTPLLDAFKAACSGIREYDAARADAAKAGWIEIAEDAEPRIARLAKLGREAVGDDMTLAEAYFRGNFGGRPAFLILTRAVDKETGIWAHGCRAYDFDVSAPIAPATLDAWMGKPPTAVQELAGATKRLWEPGWKTGVGLDISFVPAGHFQGASVGLEGNILTAQAIGGFR